MKIEHYEHHGADVAVQSHLKGRHREHCLCFQGCIKFKPGTPENCPIASDIFRACIKWNIVTPVWECPEFVDHTK